MIIFIDKNLFKKSFNDKNKVLKKTCFDFFLSGRIPYMYHRGQVFLEKCSAFEAIGKTSIIRCSNYKKVRIKQVQTGVYILDNLKKNLQI